MAKRDAWTSSNKADTVSSRPARATSLLSPLSLRTILHCLLVRSLGPTSSRSGTPNHQSQQLLIVGNGCNEHILAETFLFPMIELPAGSVVHSAVGVRTDAFLLQQVLDVFRVLEQLCLVSRFHHDGADNRLNRRDSRREHETLSQEKMLKTQAL